MINDDDWIDNAEPYSVSDPYYALFDGGYIQVDNFLVGESLDSVSEAIEVIEAFFAGMYERGLIEEM